MRHWNLQNERWTRHRRGGFTCRPHSRWREAELGLRQKRKQRKRALAWRVARGDDHNVEVDNHLAMHKRSSGLGMNQSKRRRFTYTPISFSRKRRSHG